MLDWFWKRRRETNTPPPATLPSASVEPLLQSGVAAMVELLQMAPQADDADIEAYLQSRGLTELQILRLIQFVPIAFTRFLYRRTKIQFPPEFFVMGPQGTLVGGGRIVDEPAYQAAWDHCQQVLANNSDQHYFEIVAARSGGYKAIQNLLTQGAALDELVMSPPILMG